MIAYPGYTKKMARRKKNGATQVKICNKKKVNNQDHEALCAQDSLKENEKKKQTREKRLEKKSLAEKKRLEIIRNDPVRYEEFKAKQRASYYKRKAAKKILPISERSAEDKKVIRKRNRENSRAYYQRKRLEVILE